MPDGRHREAVRRPVGVDLRPRLEPHDQPRLRPGGCPSDRNRRPGDAIYAPRETMSNDTTVTRCDDAVRVMVTTK